MYDLLQVGVDPGDFAGGLVPHFDGTDSVLLAVGILGATVMPHVVYLHSALTSNRIKPRNTAERRQLLRFQRLDVALAMGLAGFINITMLVVAAQLFHDSGRTDVDSIEGAHAGFSALLGGGAALAFAVALLASGLSSSSVGTYAGQVVMQGFINRRIPLFLRRAITMAPSLVVLAIGVDPSTTLVISQVVLSLRHPVRARADGAADAPRGHHGRARQPPADDRGREHRRLADHRAEPLPALRDLLRLEKRSWVFGPIDAPPGVGDDARGMEASARKVQAERNRKRLPPKRSEYRWARRIAGLLATVAFLGVGVAIALMILPDGGGEESAVAAAPTATPAKEKAAKKTAKKKPSKPKGPTKAQLAARTAAVAEVRRQGFTTLKLSDYDPKATLRVLVGRPVGDAAGGTRAFFFLKDDLPRQRRAPRRVRS